MQSGQDRAAEEHFELTKLETIGLAGFDWDNEDESFDHWSDMKICIPFR